MQSAAPEALAVDEEPGFVRTMYGLDDDKCKHVAALYGRVWWSAACGSFNSQQGMENQRSWDGHNDIAGNHSQFAGETDKPIAALLQDLSQRGNADETLVVWGGEFGRLPVAQKSKPGRDHNPHALTYWMTGGGVKGGVSYGETDEIGHKPPSTNATSTTSTPPSSTCWAWITRNSPIATTAATSA